MNIYTLLKQVFVVVTAATLAACSQPDESIESTAPQNAGFLTDYSLLSAPTWSDAVISKVYIDPQLAATLQKYSGVMIDQPEIFISRDSAYRGVKPDGMKMVADLIRDLLIGDMLRSGYNVVESPAEDIVYLRVALVDLNVSKASGADSYVPIATNKDNKAEIARDFMASLEIVDVNVEIELIDSMTSDVLIAGIVNQQMVLEHSESKEQISTWAALGRTLEDLTAGISCLVNKADLPVEARIEICRGSTDLSGM